MSALIIISIVVVLFVAVGFCIEIQRGKVQDLVSMRANKFFEDEDMLRQINEELEGMPIPMMRVLCSCSDEAFQKEVHAWLDRRRGTC